MSDLQRVFNPLPTLMSDLMVGPQVVDLFSEDPVPEFFTEELHDVQVVFESGAIFRKPFQQTILVRNKNKAIFRLKHHLFNRKNRK